MVKSSRRTLAAAPTDFARRLVSTALAEQGTYGGIRETDPPLRTRIRQYCRELGFREPSDIASYAWSAVFVSWCVKTAGASSAEFRFAEAHAVFVHHAIANADRGRGVFRAQSVDDYAPQIGDIIQNNRRGNRYDFTYARAHTNYESHSAVVVDFVEEGSDKYAITVGGNEGHSIGRTRVLLGAGGLIVQRRENPYIAIVQTLKADVAGEHSMVHAADVNLPLSFRKHGTFIYEADATIADYGSIDLTVAAMQRAGMTHAWIRIHGRSAYSSKQREAIRDLIAEMQPSGIAVAGWGWCQGISAASEATLALREVDRYGLQDYIADIEQEVNNSRWTQQEIEAFCRGIRAGLPGSFGITSFALIDWHAPELMKAALPFVHFVNPQVYWFDYPNQRMVNSYRRPDGSRYQVHHPGEYMDLCIDRWNALMANDIRPLVVTGQAYWNEGATQAQSEGRLLTFLNNWTGYSRVAGLNWWHFGGSSAMSHSMIERISSAALGDKTYAP